MQSVLSWRQFFYSTIDFDMSEMTLNSEVIVKTKFSPNADTCFAKTSLIITVWLDVFVLIVDYFGFEMNLNTF